MFAIVIRLDDDDDVDEDGYGNTDGGEMMMGSDGCDDEGEDDDHFRDEGGWWQEQRSKIYKAHAAFVRKHQMCKHTARRATTIMPPPIKMIEDSDRSNI